MSSRQTTKTPIADLAGALESYRPSPRAQIWAFAAIIALSAFLRFHASGVSSYWYDETVSLRFAEDPSWRSVFWDNNPPLYHTLLKLWVSLLGTGEVATRALSAAFSIGATAVMIRVGLELGGFLCAIATGLFHALFFVSILYAQETRMYALFEFAAAVQLLWFLRAELGLAEANSKKLGAASVLLALSHYLAVVPIAAESLIVACTHRRKSVSRLLWLGLGLATLVVAYFSFFKWDALDWQRYKYEAESPWKAIAIMVYQFSSESWLATAALILLVAAGEALGGPKSPEARRRRRTLAALSLAPFALMAAAMVILRREFFLSRYFIFAVPPLCAWFGLSSRQLIAGLAASGRSAPKTFGLVATLVAAPLALGVAMPGAYQPRKENWRDAAQLVAKSGAKFVMTCNKPSVAVPYFAANGIEVRQWNPAKDESHEIIRPEILSRTRIWVIDTVTNSGYHEDLVRWADEVGFVVKEQKLDTGAYSSLRLVEIIDPNP